MKIFQNRQKLYKIGKKLIKSTKSSIKSIKKLQTLIFLTFFWLKRIIHIAKQYVFHLNIHFFSLMKEKIHISFTVTAIIMSRIKYFQIQVQLQLQYSINCGVNY